MSKKGPNIVINNHVNNSNTNEQNINTVKKSSSSQKLATYVTIIAGIIAIYAFFSEEINESFGSDYDSSVEHVISE